MLCAELPAQVGSHTGSFAGMVLWKQQLCASCAAPMGAEVPGDWEWHQINYRCLWGVELADFKELTLKRGNHNHTLQALSSNDLTCYGRKGRFLHNHLLTKAGRQLLSFPPLEHHAPGMCLYLLWVFLVEGLGTKPANPNLITGWLERTACKEMTPAQGTARRHQLAAASLLAGPSVVLLVFSTFSSAQKRGVRKLALTHSENSVGQDKGLMKADTSGNPQLVASKSLKVHRKKAAPH